MEQHAKGKRHPSIIALYTWRHAMRSRVLRFATRQHERKPTQLRGCSSFFPKVRYNAEYGRRLPAAVDA